MRRQQNLSFIALIATLMSCAFFFSQQTKTEQQPARMEEDLNSGAPKVETLADVPDCSAEQDEQSTLVCFSRAALVSTRLVDARVDEILSYETDTARRMDFMDSHLAWEDSRDADCSFVRSFEDSDIQKDIAEAECQQEHNLERFAQLGQTLCGNYQADSCSEIELP
ncbi:DUF1311 domain-containing protein [bacterium]|nr:DUF1311 domain-containing protein [bacterium]